ncbi:MAG: glyoxalase [Lachnospiraceae bacterium]|nr:glyoxalase [Lachnospiraceae bacterium]
MGEFSKEVLRTFLEKQDQLFSEEVAETEEEAEAFLEDVMAVIVDSEEEVFSYLDEMGMDVTDTGDIDDISEVFRLGDGRFLIVEA